MRTLKWEELGLNIDPDLVHSNETHINGIACDHPTNDSQNQYNSRTYNRIHSDDYDHQYNVHKAIVAILNPSNSNKSNKNEDDAIQELNKLRIAHSAMEYRDHILESHLLTMKYLLAFICLVCFVFVSFKFAIVLRANRRMNFNVAACNGIYLQENDRKSDLYQSTGTMNTIQTNIAY